MTIVFQKETKRGRLYDPRHNFELKVIESEIRYDPLTGDSGRICHFILNTAPPLGLEELVRLSAVNCPFCPQTVTRLTPRFPEDLVPSGRLRRGGAILFPNLFPYDDISAVAVLSESHFLPLGEVPVAVIEDGVGIARDFFCSLERRAKAVPGYGILVWNYMPPAGASQLHPHLQVIYTSNPGSRLRRELAAEQAYRERHGRIYREDLLSAEQAEGSRWLGETGAVVWSLPFVPTGLLGDCVAVFPGKSTVAALSDGEIGDFARGLRKLLQRYADLGVWSFNLMFFPERGGSAADSHWLTAQIVPRLFLNPVVHVTDVSYPQLLMGERLCMVYPEEMTAKLRLG